MESIDQDDVIEILRMVEESNFDELHLEIGDLKLTIKKGGGETRSIQELEIGPEGPTKLTVLEEPPVAAKTQDVDTAISTDLKEKDYFEEEGLIQIKAPMLGTFYSAPKPGAPSFVEVGQSITEDNTVCIIEVMKLFNTVKAGVQGRIKKICAENGEMVEFQQTLFLVEEVTDEKKHKEKQTS